VTFSRITYHASRVISLAIGIVLLAGLFAPVQALAAKGVAGGPADPQPQPSQATPGRIYFAETAIIWAAAFWSSGSARRVVPARSCR